MDNTNNTKNTISFTALGKDYTYDLESSKDFEEMTKANWCNSLMLRDIFKNGKLVQRSRTGHLRGCTLQDGQFRFEVIDSIDDNGVQHIIGIYIQTYELEDASFIVSLYGKEYDMGFLKSELFDSLCSHRSNEDSRGRIHEIRIDEPIKLTDSLENKTMKLTQFYTKNFDRHGKLRDASMQLVISR